ncbi:hypothetical protein BXU08_07400 [Sphingomonas sp. LM7]|nr:hypothetical protein BXU08_07400 [Sphingomonas sp. LM7]
MIAAAVLVAGATAPAYAADPTTGAGSAAPAKVEKSERYCVVETPTGSHRRQKICRTRAEWIARTGHDPVNEVRK